MRPMAAPPADPVKANAFKVLEVLRGSSMDGYRLLKRTGLSAEDLSKAMEEELRSVVTVQGSLGADTIGEAYFSIQPSDLGRAEQTLSMLSLFNK
jgi:hypothetical protein